MSLNQPATYNYAYLLRLGIGISFLMQICSLLAAPMRALQASFTNHPCLDRLGQSLTCAYFWEVIWGGGRVIRANE